MDLDEDDSPLVSTGWLAARSSDPDVRILDARWYMDGRRGSDVYAQGHVPGAIHVDVDRDLAARNPQGVGGRHPLPSVSGFADTLARLGIGPDTTVVAYDDDGGSRAARVWWMLRYYGHGRGKVLDGGIQAWVAEGRPLRSGVERAPRVAAMELVAMPRLRVEKEQMKQIVDERSAVVLDARARSRYEGREEPVDPRRGHIPGALSAPYAENLEGPGGRFKTPAELRERFQSMGIFAGKHVVVYCGSGVTACHDLLALKLAGFPDAQLFEGSWSEWSADRTLPAAEGSEP